MNQIIVDESSQGRYPIRPKNINNVDAGRMGKIVAICQKKGGWLPFSGDEIAHNKQESMEVLRNIGMEKEGFIVFGADGKYRVTQKFINDCFADSPNWSSWQDSKIERAMRNAPLAVRIFLAISACIINGIIMNFVSSSFNLHYIGILPQVIYMLSGSILYGIVFRFIFLSNTDTEKGNG